MIDTVVKVIRDTIVVKPDALEIMEKSRSFYDIAWNSLMIFITIVTAIIGVLIPLFIQWLQTRSFSKITEQNTENLRQEMQTMRGNLEDLVTSRVKDTIEILRMSSQQLETKINTQLTDATDLLKRESAENTKTLQRKGLVSTFTTSASLHYHVAILSAELDRYESGLYHLVHAFDHLDLAIAHSDPGTKAEMGSMLYTMIMSTNASFFLPLKTMTREFRKDVLPTIERITLGARKCVNHFPEMVNIQRAFSEYLQLVDILAKQEE